jgi:predicted component of type VI protein secretion system
MFVREWEGRGTTPKPLVALVTILDTSSERMFSRTFAASPIRIGSRRGSDLHLRHPQVAGRHGEISFQPGCACFLNRAWSKRTCVDQWRLAHGEAVWLAEQSVIALGPFRIDVSLCKPRLRDAERSRKVTPLILPRLSVADLVADSYAGVQVSDQGTGCVSIRSSSSKEEWVRGPRSSTG